MNVISPQQWHRMGRDSFDARMVAVIRRHHPAQAARVPFEQLVQAIHRQVARARTHGLNDERSVATYVYAAWLLGEEFDRRVPAMAQVLAERRLHAAEKATAIGNFCKLAFGVLEGGPAARSAA
jgi:hypothetical protein